MSATDLSQVVDLQRVRREAEPALITDDGVWTYGQLADSVSAFGAYLIDRGVRPGDRVALLAMNSPEYLASALAIGRIGAIAVPLNYRLQRDELEYLLDHSQSSALISEPAYLPVLDAITAGWALRARVVIGSPSSQYGPDEVTPAGRWRDYTGITREYAGRSAPPAAVRPDSVQRIMYTSGTTSRPKGVLITHEMAAYNVLAHVTELELTSADRVLISSPMYHVAAWDSPGVGVLFSGGALVIMRRYDPHDALRLVREHGVTGAHLVQAIIHGIRASADGSQDLSSLRWIILGGISPEVFDDVQGLLPQARLVQGYGMTEACSAIAYLDRAHARTKLGTVGTAVPFVEFRVVDENDNDAGAGRSGEVVIRGPKVTPGYWADDDLTRTSWRGGWFHTGDGGVIDADGYLSITDRLKEMIKSGGENVASTEIERVLYRHPAVAEAAVIAVPDPTWQEVPKAYIVLKQGARATADELIVHCRGLLAGFKTPKFVQFVEQLPRNASGRVLKRTLREWSSPTHRPAPSTTQEQG